MTSGAALGRRGASVLLPSITTFDGSLGQFERGIWYSRTVLLTASKVAATKYQLLLSSGTWGNHTTSGFVG